MQKTFKNMWVVVDPKGKILIENCRKGHSSCLLYFMSNTNHGRWVWNYYATKGYTCVKVNVTFEIVKE